MCYLTSHCHSLSPERSTSSHAWWAMIVLLLSLSLTGCGHAGKAENQETHGPVASGKSSSLTATADSSRITSSKDNFKTDSDGDNDNPTGAHYDTDDNFVLSYGHAASMADMRSIARLVKRYYAAAAAGNGAKTSVRARVQAKVAPRRYRASSSEPAASSTQIP
jgi:hypothetical protein